jgi:peptidoglycan/xylan/chitin deacetylase (PgdA/CDA1 family)
VVWSEPSEQPHHLEIALALALEAPARLNAVEVPVDVELEVQRWVVAWPSEVGWLRHLEAQLVEIQLLDERIDDANRIAILNPLVEAFRQQRQLPPIDPFDEPDHFDPRRFSKGIIAANDFSHDQGHLQIDINGDQAFNSAQDFDIGLTGISSVSYDAATDQFTFAAPAPTKKIALTFDDGPDPTYTAQILSVLATYNVKATFFEIGEQVADNPQITQAIFNAGHLVEDHTWNHPDLTTLTASQIQSQLQQTSDAIFNATGVRPQYFRPPYGSMDSEVESVAESMGLKTTLWTVDTLDWDQPNTTTNAIIQEVLTNATDNGIVLMHDGGGDRSRTVDALDDIIVGLRAQGYELVTIDQINPLPPWDLFL